jgi:formylglycine-generating enzyme required for sulfatase activity
VPGLFLLLLLAQISTAPDSPQRNPQDKLMYVWVPPGTFRMGCSDGDKECYEDEKPAHTVQLTNGFWMGQTEVTVPAFMAFSNRVANSMPPGQKGSNYPITGVIWSEADAYCKWAGGRLPSEAEWEYAARGGTSGIRYGDLDSIAWTSANSGNTVHEVARKKPNAYGLYDMLGNMWEWTADWYGARYYDQSPAVDPKGPPIGDTLVDKAKGANGDIPTRTLRGGGWRGFPGVARASYRYWFVPTLRVANIGFRCVADKLP